MTEKKEKHPLENELQRLCRAVEAQNKLLENLLKQLILVKTKQLSGQIFSNFDPEAELAAMAKAKNK